MWYVRDVLYAVVYVCVSCFVVCGCGVSRRYIDVCYCDMFSVVNITIANIYIPPRDSTSTHYKTADTDIQHCIQYIINIPHSVLTGDVNAYSTLWHSYNDDHKGPRNS